MVVSLGLCAFYYINVLVIEQPIDMKVISDEMKDIGMEIW